MWTPLNPSDTSAEDLQKFGASIPYKKPAQPEEIAPAYVYLASNADSRYVRGEIISILGGKTTAS
ncbi:MAG: SDR family oxidoreductase [Chitinophagaceae bacterium]|nr:SDR family oxidoreductase [Oligoflexus sp.]